MSEWTPDRIKRLRESLGWSIREFGEYLFDYPSDSAYTAAWKLENGKLQPSACVRNVLGRLESHKSLKSEK